MEFEIRLSSVQQVQDFVSLATSSSFSVLVGSPNHWVNGKSFMEMFCLNLREYITVRLDCTQEEFEVFRAEALAITA